MPQPPIFEVKELANNVFRFMKALYGLKQVEAWNERIYFFLIIYRILKMFNET